MSNMVSDLLFYAAKKKWPKGLEALPDLLKRAANALAPTAEPVAWQLVYHDGMFSLSIYTKEEAEEYERKSVNVVAIRPLYASPHGVVNTALSVPDGWQLVPKVLTAEMSNELNLTGDFAQKAMQARYDAALLKAPLAPAETIPEGSERRPERYDS